MHVDAAHCNFSSMVLSCNKYGTDTSYGSIDRVLASVHDVFITAADIKLPMKELMNSCYQLGYEGITVMIPCFKAWWSTVCSIGGWLGSVISYVPIHTSSTTVAWLCISL